MNQDSKCTIILTTTHVADTKYVPEKEVSVLILFRLQVP